MRIPGAQKGSCQRLDLKSQTPCKSLCHPVQAKNTGAKRRNHGSEWVRRGGPGEGREKKQINVRRSCLSVWAKTEGKCVVVLFLLCVFRESQKCDSSGEINNYAITSECIPRLFELASNNHCDVITYTDKTAMTDF